MIVSLLQWVAAALGAWLGFQSNDAVGALAGAVVGWVVAWVFYKFVSMILATLLWLVVIVGAGLIFLFLANGG